MVLGRDDAVLSGLAVADGGARQNHQVQMGALHGDSCHHAASTADMVLLFDPANTSRVYYGTDTRLAELAAGALLAIWIAPSSRGTEAAEAGAASQTVQIERQAGARRAALTIVCNVLGTAALAALLTGFWFANGYLSYMYQGGYLITASYRCAPWPVP